MPTPEQIDTIRRLNDAARTHPGLASLANVTMGFQALSELDRFAALFAITRFTKFDGDNDPYGEHDFDQRFGEFGIVHGVLPNQIV